MNDKSLNIGCVQFKNIQIALIGLPIWLSKSIAIFLKKKYFSILF